jgi:hypothetical protein
MRAKLKAIKVELRKSMRRRQSARLSWERFLQFVNRFFPPIKVLQPLPFHRFDAEIRWKPPTGLKNGGAGSRALQ